MHLYDFSNYVNDFYSFSELYNHRKEEMKY